MSEWRVCDNDLLPSDSSKLYESANENLSFVKVSRDLVKRALCRPAPDEINLRGFVQTEPSFIKDILTGDLHEKKGSQDESSHI